MRTVVKSNEIGHLWAHQTQIKARAGNISFHGADYYSYNTVVASMAKSKNNRRAYLLTDHTYSPSTSSHQRIARNAIPRNAKIFYVPVGRSGYYYGYPDVSNDHQHNLSLWADHIAHDIQEAGSSREPKKSRLVLDVIDTIDKAKSYASFFGIKWKAPKLPWKKAEVDGFRNYQRERVIAQDLRRNARWDKMRAEEAERNKKRREESESIYQAWLAGQKVDTFKFGSYHPTSLRVIGDKVETSHGADFPIDHARRGLKLVDKVVASGKPWRSNGHTCKLGYYQIDSIDTNGTVRAGCHVVTIDAINRIREQLS